MGINSPQLESLGVLQVVARPTKGGEPSFLEDQMCFTSAGRALPKRTGFSVGHNSSKSWSILLLGWGLEQPGIVGGGGVGMGRSLGSLPSQSTREFRAVGEGWD